MTRSFKRWRAGIIAVTTLVVSIISNPCSSGHFCLLAGMDYRPLVKPLENYSVASGKPNLDFLV